jgi:transposase
MPWFVRLPDMQQPDKMKNTLKAAPTANAIELKNEKSSKAKRILLGVDVHLRGYQAARKIDEGVIGVVDSFRSEVELLLHVERQRQRAEQVVVVYEAGPLGYTLYRKLQAAGVLCYVCAPDGAEQRRKRRKNNKIDARNLTSKLFNYLNGDKAALQLARVPTEAQEQLRLASRQHDQLVEERKRLGAQGNAILLSQGFGSWSNWWRPKAWAQLSSVVPAWLLERLKIWVEVLKILDEKIAQAKAALARACSGPRPKGVGALSQMQLRSEVLDWSLYSNRRKIACLAGMVPSEWSTGDQERRGSITKVGVPALRRIIVEMVWRIVLFQPQYKPVQKWQEVLKGTNPALKKKAVVAIGRQLIVDLWRLETGRVTAQELNLVMIGANEA